MDGKELLKNIEHIPKEDQHAIVKAINFVNLHHDGQLRKSGDPYSSHLFAVGLNLWQLYHDPILTIAGLLHDAVEDCEEVTIEEIYRDFGKEVGFLVDAATKNIFTFLEYPEITFDDKIERLLWAGQKDIRALLLKTADRDHNMSTIEHLKPEKQVRMAFETQAIFQPLKNILRDHASSTSIEQTTLSFQNFCTNNKVTTPRELKEYLFNHSFKEFGHELFEAVYKMSTSIIWEVEDADFMASLEQAPSFKEGIQVLSYWTNGTNFKALFQFKKGVILSPQHSPLKIGSLKQ